MAIFNSYVKLPEGRMEEHDNRLAVWKNLSSLIVGCFARIHNIRTHCRFDVQLAFVHVALAIVTIVHSHVCVY